MMLMKSGSMVVEGEPDIIVEGSTEDCLRERVYVTKKMS